jgi:microcompartment protein CcmL/EutN
MARYIKIKKENINIAGSDTDLLVGKVSAVAAGNENGNNTADEVTIFDQDGMFYTFVVTGSSAAWTQSIQNAVTANPGGVLSTVIIPASAAKATAAVVSRFI